MLPVIKLYLGENRDFHTQCSVASLWEAPERSQPTVEMTLLPRQHGSIVWLGTNGTDGEKFGCEGYLVTDGTKKLQT